MAFRFTREDPDLGSAVRRVAWEQAHRGAEAAEDGARPIGDRVHEVRRRTKKIRALLRLVRPGLDAARAENRVLRRAARRLSGVRDRRVLMETLDRVVRETEEPVDVAAVSALRAQLSREALTAEGAEDVRDAVGAAGGELRALIGRLSGWRVEGKERKALRGLERTVRRAREALDGADVEDAESLHEWRKRVKDHRDQMRLLAPTHAPLKGRVKALRALADRLGEHHDLAVLREALGDASFAPATLAQLGAHCEGRCAAIARELLPEGRRVFAESPGALHARVAVYWRERLR